MAGIDYEPMKSIRFPSVGTCIYCDSSHDLTDEHVIPRGMGGKWILPDSSCRSCAAVTSTFEGRLLRSEGWWPLRRALEIVSRRPYEQPDHFTAVEATDGPPRVIRVAVEDHPLAIPILRFDPPTHLTGMPLPDIESTVAKGISILPLRPLIGLDRAEVMIVGAARRRSVTYGVGLDAADLARLVAKIGWSWAVGRHGLSAFAEPYVRDLILGNVAGGNQWFGELFSAPILDSQELHVAGEVRHGDDLAVWVQLFRTSINNTEAWPSYQAVVARLRPTTSAA